MNKVMTFFWFDVNAEEAVTFYLSLFADARLIDRTPVPGGSVISLTFEIAGQQFVALNGGPYYKLTPAASILVRCESQAEVDRLWGALTAGGEEMQCGWLTDRFGLTWQIVPTRLFQLLADPDPGRAGRAMQSMLGMRKIDIAALERAAEGT